MQENITEKKKLDITKLSNELTYQRYLFNRNQMKQLFQKLSVPEYIALQKRQIYQKLARILQFILAGLI